MHPTDKKPVEAYQWFKNGDHPKDECRMIYPSQYGMKFKPFLSNGKVVRQYIPDNLKDIYIECKECGNILHSHGYIKTPDGREFIVCPGDWIITESEGVYVPCKPEEFKLLFINQVDGQC